MNWGRIVAGVTAMGFAGWATSSSWTSEIPYEPAIGLFAAFCAWIGFEYRGRQSNVIAAAIEARSLANDLSPHDLQLGRRLRAAFPSVTRTFLRDRPFGSPYHQSRTEPLEPLGDEWRGGEYEFEDRELNENSEDVLRDARAFLDKLAVYSGVADRYPSGTFSVPTDSERANDNFEQHTRSHIEELERIAKNLLDSFESFERCLRRKAPTLFSEAFF